jgi:ABC-type hemin transport system substrate-binding protein
MSYRGYPLLMKPERIVSLVPSLTETLFAFGVGERVVGRTRYCTQPPRSVGKVAKVGGTKKVDVGRVLDLEPDLVVAVREENTREDIERLKEAGVSVFVGTPETVKGALGMLKELAGRVGTPEDAAEAVLGPIERVYQRLYEVEPEKTRRVFVTIWKGPYMSVGSDTYVHDVLRTCGGENVCGSATRYPIVTLEEVEGLEPEVVLLPDEPYPFSAEDLAEFYALDIPASREDTIHLVDGKLLTWYGPRMASSLMQLSALLRF